MPSRLLNVDSRFGDRFDGTTYEHDPVVGIFHDSDLRPKELWLPERLFHRIVYVAEAYSLHILPLLGSEDLHFLNHQQADVLLDELVFIRGVINDPLLEEHLSAFVDLVVIASRDHNWGAAIRVEME